MTHSNRKTECCCNRIKSIRTQCQHTHQNVGLNESWKSLENVCSRLISLMLFSVHHFVEMECFLPSSIRTWKFYLFKQKKCWWIFRLNEIMCDVRNGAHFYEIRNAIQVEPPNNIHTYVRTYQYQFMFIEMIVKWASKQTNEFEYNIHSNDFHAYQFWFYQNAMQTEVLNVIWIPIPHFSLQFTSRHFETGASHKTSLFVIYFVLFIPYIFSISPFTKIKIS